MAKFTGNFMAGVGKCGASEDLQALAISGQLRDYCQIKKLKDDWFFVSLKPGLDFIICTADEIPGIVSMFEACFIPERPKPVEKPKVSSDEAARIAEALAELGL